jgi:hypothetical protein
MFQICVHDQKVQRKKQCYNFEYCFKCNDKNINIQNVINFTKISNLYTLINVFTKKSTKNSYISVLFIYFKFNGSNKIKMWHF